LKKGLNISFNTIVYNEIKNNTKPANRRKEVSKEKVFIFHNHSSGT